MLFSVLEDREYRLKRWILTSWIFLFLKLLLFNLLGSNKMTLPHDTVVSKSLLPSFLLTNMVSTFDVRQGPGQQALSENHHARGALSLLHTLLSRSRPRAQNTASQASRTSISAPKSTNELPQFPANTDQSGRGPSHQSGGGNRRYTSRVSPLLWEANLTVLCAVSLFSSRRSPKKPCLCLWLWGPASFLSLCGAPGALHGQGFWHRQGPPMTLTAGLYPEFTLPSKQNLGVGIFIVEITEPFSSMDPEQRRPWLGCTPHLGGRKTLTSCVTLSMLVNLSDLCLSHL